MSKYYPNMPNKEYWINRVLDRNNKYFDKAEDLNKALKKEYEKAWKEIQKEISFFYTKYADGKGILTYSEANRYKRMFNLFKDIDDIVYDLNEMGQKEVTKHLDDTYKNNYEDAVIELSEGLGVTATFGKVDKEVIKEVLNYPWSGEMFSNRIHNNTELLARKLKEELTQGFIKGSSVQKMARNLNRTMDSGYKNMLRVTRTETAYVIGESTKKGYMDNGLEKYEYLAYLDHRTSTICKELDGKVFKLKDAQAGTNFPPMHSNCRSCVLPVI